MAQQAGVGFLIAVTLAAGALDAEDGREAPPLSIGARARIETIGGGSVVGTFSGAEDGALRLDDGGTAHRILRHHVRRIQVSTGKKRNGAKGALIGGAVGLGIGLLLAGFVGPVPACLDEPPRTFCQQRQWEPAYIPISVVTYAVLGAGVGVLVRSDRWRDVALDGIPKVDGPPRGMRVAFAFRF